MLLVTPNTFANGTGEANIIDAPKMNANFDQIETVLNGNIEKNNVKAGSAIALLDTHLHISANWQFDTNPTFNAGGIADSALTSNIPKKDAANTFTAVQTFDANIDLNLNQAKDFCIEQVDGLPAWVAGYKGRVVYNTQDNKFYGANNSTWIDLGYIGGYTGGAIRSYSDMGEVDDGAPYVLKFKTEGASPTVKIFLKGEPYPSRHYTDLPYHTHDFTGGSHTHTKVDPGHTHSVTIGSHDHGTTQFSLSTHSHSLSGNTASSAHSHHLESLITSATTASHTHAVGTLAIDFDGNHEHDGVTVGTALTDIAGNHNHTISGATASGGASHTHTTHGDTNNESPAHNHAAGTLAVGIPTANASVSSKDLGSKTSASSTTGITINSTAVSGTNAGAGVDVGSLSLSRKQYALDLVVEIDGVTVTDDVLTATGWSQIGNGTGGHAFHSSGTGEMDASAWKTYAAGFHTLKIFETSYDYGCGLLVHIETY